MNTGFPVFRRCRRRSRQGERERFIYYVFDLLHLDGRDLTRAAAGRAQGRAGAARRPTSRERTGHLQRAFRGGRHGSSHHACAMGLEGIVSKRADAPYRSGRVETFIKTKCANAQEFVVGGYSPRPRCRERSARWWSAITTTAGSSMPGASAPATRTRRARFVEAAASRIETEQAALRCDPARARRGARDVRWVEPKMVIEAAFARLDRATVWCGRRRSRACARTSRRGRWCASWLAASSGGGGSGASRRPKTRSGGGQRAMARSRPRRRSPRSRARRKSARANESRRQSRKATSASPIPTACIGPMSASPSRISPITIARSGTGWRRMLSIGRSRWCAVPTAPRASASFRSTPRPV